MDNPVTSITSLSVEVVDYLVLDDPLYYQNHVFVLQVWLEQDLYEVQRSYAAFLELDSRLRRKYPRSALPALNLAGARESAPPKNKRFSLLKGGKDKERERETHTAGGGSNHASSREKERERTRSMSFSDSLSLLHHRESLSHSDSLSSAAAAGTGTGTGSAGNSTKRFGANKQLTRRVESNEVIAQKKSVLTYYLADLMRIPEVLMSSTLLYFLDEEAIDGDPLEESEDVLENQEFLLLLEDETRNMKTVRKDFKLSLHVESGDVVVWSFATKLRDIAFCVWFNTQEVSAYPYRRYNAHEYTIYGLFDVPSAGQVDLVWDNSYAKFHSKTVVYSVRILKREHYEQVLLRSQELRESKERFAQARKRLYKILQKLSLEALEKSNGLPVVSADNGADEDHDTLHTHEQEDAWTTYPAAEDETTVSAPQQDKDTENRSSLTRTEEDAGQCISASAATDGSVENIANEKEAQDDERATETETEQHVQDHLPSSVNVYSRRTEEIAFVSLPRNKQLKELQDLQAQIEKLKYEKQYLQIAYTQCEKALVDERNACAEKQQQCDDLQLAKDLLDEELDEAKREVDSLKTDYQELLTSQMTLSVSRNDAYKLPIEELLKFPSNSAAEEMLNKPEVALANFAMLLQFAREVHGELAEQQQVRLAQEQQLVKSKTERKALKTAALQLKEKSEQLEREKMQLEHDLDLLATERNALLAKTTELEQELGETKARLDRQELLLAATRMEEVVHKEPVYMRPRYGSESEQYDDNTDANAGENNVNEHKSGRIIDESRSEDSSCGDDDEDDDDGDDVVDIPSASQMIEKLWNDMPIEETVERVIPDPSGTSTQVVIDFSKQEPDEVSHYFNNFASSMRVGWDSLMHSVEDNLHHSTHSSHGYSSHSSVSNTSATMSSPVRPQTQGKATTDKIPPKLNYVFFR